MRRAFAALAALVLLSPATATAKSSEEHKAARPDLFHPETGLRIARQRAPTPDDVPGARRIDREGTHELRDMGAVLIDVGAAAQSRFDEIDGTWLVREPHLTIPGAVWLPEVGRGTLTPQMQRYLESNLDRLTYNKDHVVIVFCIADCWMSWNAAQRITALGYTQVLWFAEGTDGWLDDGLELAPVDPVPVEVD